MGMKQRLGIAIALLNDPHLLILDEPTNGLDPFGIQKLRELISSFPERGITVILSSHILSEVQAVISDSQRAVFYRVLLQIGENLEEFFMDVVRGGEKTCMC